MKMISHVMTLTQDTVDSATFNVTEVIQKELLSKLREEVSSRVNQQIPNIEWEVMVKNCVQFETIWRPSEHLWKAIVTMALPENKTDYFVKEETNA